MQGLLARAFPRPRTWVDFGALLQRLGRWEEAAKQYQRLPEGQALRHDQLASLLCARGGPEESLSTLAARDEFGPLERGRSGGQPQGTGSLAEAIIGAAMGSAGMTPHANTFWLFINSLW